MSTKTERLERSRTAPKELKSLVEMNKDSGDKGSETEDGLSARVAGCLKS